MLMENFEATNEKTQLHQGTSGLDTGKKFFSAEVIGHWNGLPGEVAESPSLEVLQEVALSAMGWLARWCWVMMISEVFSSLHDSVKYSLEFTWSRGTRKGVSKPVLNKYSGTILSEKKPKEISQLCHVEGTGEVPTFDPFIWEMSQDRSSDTSSRKKRISSRQTVLSF